MYTVLYDRSYEHAKKFKRRLLGGKRSTISWTFYFRVTILKKKIIFAIFWSETKRLVLPISLFFNLKYPLIYNVL